jgi:putative glycosyltransferase (TIGR04372 family)
MSSLAFINRNISQIKLGGSKVLVRKIISLVELPIGGVIILICYALKPFIKIRFGQLYTSRIGHLCYNMDNYLSSRRGRYSNEWGVFGIDKRISNKAIYSLWRQQKRILFTALARPPLHFLINFMPASQLLISWKNELHPEVSVASATPPNILLSQSDEIRGERLLKALGITRPFICLHNRDSAYLEHYGSDGNNHEYRDFDFDDFELGIKKITESGVMAVRLGEKIKKESGIDNPRFVSITGSKRSDFSDVYLIAKSQFFVGGLTGFSNVSGLFRKPQLLIDYMPLRLQELSAWAAESLVVPKKLYNISERRYLRFSEMVALLYDIHYQGDFFGDRGLRVENNSQEEIADAIVEMQSRLAGTWHDSEVQQQLQNRFWDSVGGERHATVIRDELKIKISSTFLERNLELL